MTEGTNARDGRSPSLARPGLLIAGGLVVVLLIVAVLFLTGAFGGGDGGGSQSAAPEEVSVEELRDFASSSGRAVYWAGPIPNRRLELTEADGGNVYVRYLTNDAVVGDGRPAFTTVGTYPVTDAYAEVEKRAQGKGQESEEAPGGGLATWSEKRPSSVYVAFPGSDLLVEVYDPDPERAQELALSGEVGPVR